MIQRYERARGLTLFKSGKYQIELWFIPSNYEVPLHVHNNFDSNIFVIFCHDIIFRKDDKMLLLNWWNFKRLFFIQNGVAHKFYKSRFPLIFLNIEKWNSNEITSACKDFNLCQ